MKKFYTAPAITVIAAEPGCILAGSGRDNPREPSYFEGAIRQYGATGDAFSDETLGTGNATKDMTFTNGSGGGGGNRAKGDNGLWDDEW